MEPLAGYTIGITAARRREEFGAALERRGASVRYGPAIRIVPLADDTQLREATDRCLAAPLDLAIATTGIGFRGWMDAAETWGLAEPLTKALDSAVLLARGPKARGALRASGLREAWSPASESSNEVLEHLIEHHDLDGRRIAVQLHGEPLPDLIETLRAAGADVIEVPVYRWIGPADPAPLRRLIDAVATAELDAVAFTSAPAVVSFLRTSQELGLREAVLEALGGQVVAAGVGPVTSGPLLDLGIPVVQPARARLGALVREIVEQVPRRRGLLLPVAEGWLDIRGQAAVADGRVVPLSRTAMALLRRLAARPGHVVTRRELLPPGGSDEHAVEVAIGRLRAALGNPRIIQTVAKRGYRLAFDPERGAVDTADWRY
ncbi:uroporphyrinogen-III synthase [Frankia sp. R82]|nr:uroporphyrinogen-III synthase [Frankia sp. R82]MCM3883234.1 uroporphyrinogen-III synthase [Frankia sp. R82]